MVVNGSLPKPRDGPPKFTHAHNQCQHNTPRGRRLHACSNFPGKGQSGLVGLFTFDGDAFLCQQDPFPLRTPSISAQASVLVYDPVARDHHGHRIRSHGPGDGPDRGWATDGARHLAVGTRRPVRDGAQLFPYAPLKSGGLQIDGKVKAGALALKMAQDAADPVDQAALRPSVALNLGVRILRSQGSFEISIRVPQADRADASLRRSYQEPA